MSGSQPGRQPSGGAVQPASLPLGIPAAGFCHGPFASQAPGAPPTIRRDADTFLRPQCVFLERMAGIARLILTAEETQKRELCHPSWGAIS